MIREIHSFDNGIKVYNEHLLPIQRARYQQWNVHEAEEEEIFIEIIQSIPSKGCYIDIGSAIGYYPLLAKSLAPELIIHAIEPLRRHREFFIENIKLNKLSQSDLTIHAEGISSSNSIAMFLDDGYESSLQKSSSLISALTFLKRLIMHMNTISIIRTRTLDDFLTDINQPVELCQMDVQGLESDVLKGAQNALQTGKIKTFLIGTHSRDLHQDCIDFLSKNGYIVEFDKFDTTKQPDGILVASINTRRLNQSKMKP